MTRLLAMLLLMIGLLAPTGARAEERTCAVRYLSAEHVYLDAGAAAGLTVGLRARVVRDGVAVAELEVVYAAEHSASCRLVGEAAGVAVGDQVVFEAATMEEPEAVAAAPVRTRPTPEPGSATDGGEPVRLRGRVALQWDHAREDADRALGTDILRLPFRVKATGLGANLEFRARGSLRHMGRTGFTSSTSADEWRNRILELALVREGRDLTWSFAVGRIGSRRAAAIGPFDGLEVGVRLGAGVSLGVFGGFAPAWGTLGFSDDDHVAGLAANWHRVTGSRGALDLTLTGAGRYRGGEISREWLSLVTTWHDGGRLSLLQAAELDVNRGWRQDAAGGSSTSLTSGALTARYRFSSQWSANLGYDDREPVRTWETRALPDSLFTDAGRKGWRGGLSWRHRMGVSADATAGVRREDGSGEETKSWALAVRLSERLLRYVRLSARMRGFDGPWLSGTSPSLRLDRRMSHVLRLHLEGGYFAYEGRTADTTRDNTWAGLGASVDLTAGWDVHASLRRDWGDDMAGYRLYLDLAHRF